MKVKYVGPIDEVDVALPDGTHQRVAQGDTIDVPAELAEGFVGEAWEKAGGKKEEVKGDG